MNNPTDSTNQTTNQTSIDEPNKEESGKIEVISTQIDSPEDKPATAEPVTDLNQGLNQVIEENKTETKLEEPKVEEPKPEEPKQDYGQIEVQHYDNPYKRPLATLEETLGEKPTDDDMPGKPEHREPEVAKPETAQEEMIEPEKIEDQEMPQETANMNPAPMEEDTADTMTDDQPKVVNFRPAAMPPVKAYNENRSVVTTAVVAAIILAGGFAAGFGGYRFIEGQTASADTVIEMKEAPKTIETETTTPPQTETKTENPATASWKSYDNTKFKYSIKYPDKWYGQGLDSATSNTIQLTSFKPTTTGTTMTEGQKVEVVFQDLNAKTLTAWIEANNTIMASKVTKTEKTTIDGKEAVQETLSAPIKSVVTYVIQADKMMVITYYAATKDFDSGLKTFSDIIKTINFN